jgi:ribonucleoside-diphosphate reductase beta chain
MSQTVINNWHDRNDDKDMLKIRKECEKEVYKMYDEAVQEEKRWATYLFSQGSMIGLSEKLLHQFVEYMANRRMKGIGLEPKYEQKTNPLPWVDHWLNSKSMQNAPQETEIESYVIGGIKQDVKKDQFKTFKL